MSDDLKMILVRKSEVSELFSKMKAGRAQWEAELVELETARRVVERLSGALGAETRPADERPATVIAVPSNTPSLGKSPPTITQMILEVLLLAQEIELEGLAPREIAREISRQFRVENKGEYVSSICWRLWKRGQIVKVRDGVYALPPTKRASDLLSREDQSEAPVQPDAQGGEARPGGGT